MSRLLTWFGSKKLAALVGAIVATLLVPLLNRKLGLNLDPTEVATLITGIAATFIGYAAAQAHVDAKTNGQTTIAYQLVQAAAGAGATTLKPGTDLQKLAAAIVQALKDDAAATSPAAQPGTAPVPPVAPPR